MSVRVMQGDCREVLKTLPDESVHCVVCSPPYWGLRDYQVAGQIGLESSPDEYVAELVAVFREVRRVMRKDATLWLNLGDSYSGSGKGGNPEAGKQATNKGSQTIGTLYGKTGETARQAAVTNVSRRMCAEQGFPPKQLIGIPWRVAFALQADGWWLRQDIIWCLSGGAWVYARTQKGDMPVMVKDLVRLDPATVQLWNGEKWTRVLGWGPSNDESERVELVLRSGERIGCTGGHQWPTHRGNVAARDLRVGDTIGTCRLPEPAICERPAYVTNDALWLIGLYLAEGSRNGSARQLSLSADEERWLPRIRAVAKHYGGSCTHTVGGESLSVRLYGAVLHALLDTYIGGSVAIDKHLKVAAWRLPNESLSALVQGYLDGDGYADAGNGRWRLGFCRNYALERDLRTLSARLGATLTLKPGTATYQGGESPIFRGEWRWERSGHWNEKDRGEVVEIRASRARGFWDIAVADEPNLFALASGVLTHNCKPNPMPESVTDRCTKSHEYIFLMAKAERYYYDAAAIAEQFADERMGNPGRYQWKQGEGGVAGGGPNSLHKGDGVVEGWNTDGSKAGRNKRSVWTVTTKPFTEAHFATFPPDLIEPCILAGTSEHGCCSKCGAPWERVIEGVAPDGRRAILKGGKGYTDDGRPLMGDNMIDAGVRGSFTSSGGATLERRTVGWQPTCECGADVVPGTVLDPFGGAGTTGLVADRLQRNAILIELNPQYAEMARGRIIGDAPLFAEVA